MRKTRKILMSAGLSTRPALDYTTQVRVYLNLSTTRQSTLAKDLILQLIALKMPSGGLRDQSVETRLRRNEEKTR